MENRYSQQSEMERIFDLEWKFYESLLQSAVEFVIYSATIYLGIKIGGFKIDKFPTKNHHIFVIESALISFYGNLFVVFSIIWRLHGQLLFKMLTRIFVMVSHLQVQRGL